MQPNKRSARATGAEVKKQDGRPLKDRDFQSECAKRVIEFLVKRVFPSPLSLGMLLSPDMSLFWEIVSFVLEDSSIRSAEALLPILRGLKYPYEITPKMLTGCHFFWGNLLALATWMCDLASSSAGLSLYSDYDRYMTQAYNLSINHQFDTQTRLLLVQEYSREIVYKKEALENQIELIRSAISTQNQVIETRQQLEEQIELVENFKLKQNQYQTDIQLQIRKLKDVSGFLVSSLRLKNRDSECLDRDLDRIINEKRELKTLLGDLVRKNQELDKKIAEKKEMMEEMNDFYASDLKKHKDVLERDTMSIAIHAEMIANYLEEINK